MSLVVAVLASATIVLISPFMGLLQSYLRRSLTTDQYVLLFGVGVLGAVGLAILIAFLRIRERRAQRLALLIAALLFGGGYLWATATPYADVNAVERVHFVSYGSVAFLFYRVWRSAGDLSTILLPLIVAFMVGTLDEWLQWFIPYRVGEAHDVFLNLASIGCGLMFGVALIPPASFGWRLDGSSCARIGLISAMVFLVFAGFVGQVHVGHTVQLEDGGRFRSHYSAEQLQALQQDRLVRWRTQPPIRIARLSREDQYLDEALWHVRRRNTGEPRDAWYENLILERFFTPVLDLPTYAAPEGARWPAEQRVNLQAAVPPSTEPFVSTAEAYPILDWPKSIYWPTAMATALLLIALPRVFARPALRTDPSRSSPPAS